MGMDERFDRLEKIILDLKSTFKAELGALGRDTAALFRQTNVRIDVNSRQIAGLSKRIDSLTADQKQFAARFGERLEKAEAKADITIEGHEAIRSEMHREFANLRRDLDLRVQPIEVAIKKRPRA